jgi:hypothetical protein
MEKNAIIPEELMNIMNGLKKATFAHIEYVSEVKLPKKLGLGLVTKTTSGTVQLYYNYGSAVNRRLTANGEVAEFKAEPLPWGEWYLADRLISHKEQFYLRFYLLRGEHMESVYYVDGRPATEDEVTLITAYLKQTRKGSNTQAAAGLTDRQVMPKGVNIANIRKLVAGGKTYTA